MLSRFLIPSAFVFFLAYGTFAESLPQEAQKQLKGFKTDLKAALVSSIQKGGLESAVHVCKEVAPEIANQYSNENISIGRSARRIRNSNNKAESWMLEAFDSFAKSKKENVQKNWSQSGEAFVRYAEPIYTDAVCLNCHGSTIAPAVKASIQKQYPNDRATGFELGELRGIFWVKIKKP